MRFCGSKISTARNILLSDTHRALVSCGACPIGSANPSRKKSPRALASTTISAFASSTRIAAEFSLSLPRRNFPSRLATKYRRPRSVKPVRTRNRHCQKSRALRNYQNLVLPPRQMRLGPLRSCRRAPQGQPRLRLRPQRSSIFRPLQRVHRCSKPLTESKAIRS